ncbi:MAG TPA: peptidoglycan DD-metalloendopeptidase family protein [Bryobacteraceae bacterium]|nr:peptidoglycan DD-metalloendopeptidase family protein [Bryobacteraceae bacterium]
MISLLMTLIPAPGATVPQADLGPSASDDACTLPKTATSFASTTRQVFLRFVVANIRASDSLSVEWVDPAGNIASSAPYDQLPGAGSLCLLAQLPVGGFAPASNPGRWSVRILAKRSILAERHFQIVTGQAAGAPEIVRLINRQITAEENELILEGEGFNLESLIHLAQYTNAGGWHYIEHLFPQSLTPTRMTVRVRSLKPAEYVVFVKNGEHLSPPARFLISAPGYHLPFPPSEQWVISQPPYGMYSHWGRTVHAFDIAPRSGGCVVAMRPGIARTFDLGYGQTPHRRIFGNYITIEHEDGEFSHYAHLRSGTYRVRNGDRVEQGQALAIAGTSGYSFGTHVHVQVTRAFPISSQSIPFKVEDLAPTQQNGYRGPVQSANGSPYGTCSGPKPASPTLISSSSKPAAPALPPTWSPRVAVAAWWSDLTQVPPGTRVLEIKLGWDSPDRDFDLHLVSPSGRHYGSYGDRTGYDAAASTEEWFRLPNPEPGTWRVSVQGVRGGGEPMPFHVFRSLSDSAARNAWGGARPTR